MRVELKCLVKLSILYLKGGEYDMHSIPELKSAFCFTVAWYQYIPKA